MICSLLASAGCGGHGHGGHGAHDATVHHRFENPEKWGERFDAPERDAWQQPDVVIDALKIQPGQFVADIGAGTGYFTVRISPVVGVDGRVLAVDVEPEMVEYIRTRAAKAGLKNVEPILTTPDTPGLGADSVDLAFICDTWHHIDNRIDYLNQLRKTLRKGGKVAIVDFKEGKLPVGPPQGHKLSRQAVIEEFTTAGWTLRKEIDVLAYQYILVFEP